MGIDLHIGEALPPLAWYLEQVEPAEWENVSVTYADYNCQQDWAYVSSLCSYEGSCFEAVRIKSEEEVLGVALVRLRKIPLLGTGVAYIAGGPLVKRGTIGDVQRFRQCVEALFGEYVRKRGFVLRILGGVSDEKWNLEIERTLGALGFTRNLRARAYRTLLLDLEHPLEVIRKRFAQKWRNGLNRAETQKVEIVFSQDSDAFAKFRLFHAEFIQGKEIQVQLDAAFFAHVAERGGSFAGLTVAWALSEGQIVAGHLGSYVGDTTVYLLGFSTDKARKLGATYLLQWAVIRKARAMGCKWYDLGGIDPEYNPGVFHFKAGLGGLDVRAAGPMDGRPGWLKYTLVVTIELFFRRLRSLKNLIEKRLARSSG